MAEKNLTLRSSAELRRPDQLGQIRHIFVLTSHDKPLAELDVDDIMQVNWHGAITMLRDATLAVQHEGGLSSQTLQETIRLTALVLRRLEYEDAEFQKKLTDFPPVGFLGWIIAALPIFGANNRKIIGIRSQAKKKSNALGDIRDKIFKQREKLAKVVDQLIHDQLTAEDEVYRALSEGLRVTLPTRRTCRDILYQLERVDEIEQDLAHEHQRPKDHRDLNHEAELETEAQQISSRIGAYCAFYNQNAGAEAKVSKNNRGELHARIAELLTRLDEADSPTEARLAAMRRVVKQRLYAEASETLGT